MLHTDIPTLADIEKLATVRDGTCVSIYLPTSPVPSSADVPRIEVKNLVRQAVDQLVDGAVDKREITSLEELADELLGDEIFWTYLSNSLAIFLTPHEIRTFRLPNQLTTALEVSDRFYVKPLLRAVTFPHVAFVLGLAQNSVRLIEVTPDSAPFEVAVDELPRDIESALGVAVTEDRQLSARLVGAEGEKVRLRQYARVVDRALRPILSGREAPLILAAAEPLASIYRSVNSYAHLATGGIDGNPEASPDAQLADAARGILDGIYQEEVGEVRRRMEDREPRELVATDLQHVARAATYGAVDILLVDIDEHLPGFLDEETGAVTLNETGDASDYGVVDEIARRALRTGARVLAVRSEDIPGGAAAAALLRFAV